MNPKLHPDSLLSLVETALVALEGRFLLVIKGAKDYFFLSTIVALVKAKLFSRHAPCEHLGLLGMGCFKDNQGRWLPSDFDSILPPPNLGVAPPGDFDPFLEVFDWEELTGMAIDVVNPVGGV